MHSKNSFSADNQQERSKEYQRGYVVGLTDGEGSFHIAFQARKDLPLGISIIPEFHISQNYQSRSVLEAVRNILGCGYLKPNHRNSKDATYVLVVRDRVDLLTKVIPFFEINPLRTTKADDFALFARVIRLMQSGAHKSAGSVKEIIDLAYSMNGNGKRRTRTKIQLLASLKSSETIRRTRRRGGKI